MSPSASAHGLPTSKTSTADNSNRRRSMIAATRSSSCARCSTETRHQCSNAARAALTARSASGNSRFRDFADDLVRHARVERGHSFPGVTFSPSITSGYFLPNRLRTWSQSGSHLFLRLAMNEVDQWSVFVAVARRGGAICAVGRMRVTRGGLTGEANARVSS